LVTVTPVNDAPTITSIADQTILEDGATGALSFTIGDIDNGIAQLSVSGTSLNTALVPNANVVISPSGASRTVTVTPAANGNGVTTITLSVTDGAATTTTQFQLTVTAVNDAPTLDPINDLIIAQDSGAQTVSLTGIAASPANEIQGLTVTAVSSNPGLIPDPTVTYSSPDSTGTLVLTPVAGASGSALLTVTITDDGGTSGGGQNSVTQTFNVTVSPQPTQPILQIVRLGNDIQISFETITGKTYVVSYKDSVSDTEWTTLSSPAGTGLTVSVSAPITNGPFRMFRVQVQ
jgi:hypothetical protein